MLRCRYYGGSSSVNPTDEEKADLEAEGSRSYDADESKETQTRSSQRSVGSDNEMRVVAPSIEDLDPAVTAAILTQVTCGVLHHGTNSMNYS